MIRLMVVHVFVFPGGPLTLTSFLPIASICVVLAASMTEGHGRSFRMAFPYLTVLSMVCRINLSLRLPEPMKHSASSQLGSSIAALAFFGPALLLILLITNTKTDSSCGSRMDCLFSHFMVWMETGTSISSRNLGQLSLVA